MPIRFQVDPDFYDHPKTTGMSDTAFALWVRAGSFSAAKATDGFISEDVLAITLRYESTVADELVRRGLWRRVKGGYRFHEWDHRNLTKSRIENDRKADRERKAKTRSSGTNSAGQNGNQHVETAFVRPESERNPDGIQPESDRIPGASVSVSVSESVSGSGHVASAPSPRCGLHTDNPTTDPCGPCGEARRRREQWDLVEAERRRNAPKCRTHRGQPATTCAPCRSERLALVGRTGSFPLIVPRGATA
jgi:ribosomal protein L37E